MFFNELKRAKKRLAEHENKAVLMELRYKELYEEAFALIKKNRDLEGTNENLKKTNKRLFRDIKAEREVKERYRIAFLRRMNVPVIGTSWDGSRPGEEPEVWDGR